jgi:hypothetical protein
MILVFQQIGTATVFLLTSKGDGRVYTITVCSTDALGNNTGSTTFTVEVPHDSGSHSCDDPNCDLNSSATTE